MSETKLPPLDVCPEELKHGYPNCDCDLVGGDDSCTKTPTYDEVRDKYDPQKQRERQLTAALEREEKLKEMNRELAEVNTELQKLVDEACTAGENTEAEVAALQVAARDALEVMDDATKVSTRQVFLARLEALRGLVEGK